MRNIISLFIKIDLKNNIQNIPYIHYNTGINRIKVTQYWKWFPFTLKISEWKTIFMNMLNSKRDIALIYQCVTKRIFKLQNFGELIYKSKKLQTFTEYSYMSRVLHTRMKIIININIQPVVTDKREPVTVLDRNLNLLACNLQSIARTQLFAIKWKFNTWSRMW